MRGVAFKAFNETFYLYCSTVSAII